MFKKTNNKYIKQNMKSTSARAGTNLLPLCGAYLCFVMMGCGQEQNTEMTLLLEKKLKAGNPEIVPHIMDICSCQEMRKSQYACETRSKYWPGCNYSPPEKGKSTGRCDKKEDGENELYSTFDSCMGLLDQMITLNATELWPPEYDEIRCCLGNQILKEKEQCVRYHCAEKLLLHMPYICQTNFFRTKDTLCRLAPEDSILKECHAVKCEIPLLKYDSEDMFNLLAAASISTFVCAISAAVYTKRKRQRTLEWAKLEGRVMGGDTVSGDGGEDHLLGVLAQKERRARTWYYVSKQGKVVGPLTEEDMRLRKVAGLFDQDLMVRVNDSDWKTLSNFYPNPELEAFEAKTRPIILNVKK
eukprot:GEMP01068062.1.p1 GENE.GEMP01068062.1~~GEMP01068062.1.p1  ORF type:complete len:357 (+),score=75.62 GEMP01068062.1:130-1200(+)